MQRRIALQFQQVMQQGLLHGIILSAQKACSTAGLDYDKVVSQAVVWQTPDTDGADSAPAVKQDGEDVKPQTGWTFHAM